MHLRLVLDESRHLRIFEVAGYESVLSIWKFNMTDPKWLTES